MAGSVKKEKVIVNSMQENELDQEGKHLFANGLGTAFLGFDPRVSRGEEVSQVDTIFKNNRWYLISNMRQVLSQFYVENGIVQTFIDIPVDDALRGGIEVHTDELDEADIKLLHQKMDREEDFITVGQAMKWVRLFGGGGLIINVDERAEDEFKVENIKKGEENIEFIPVDMWELFSDRMFAEDNEIERLDKRFADNKTSYNYYGQQIHHSRVLRIKGKRAPSFVRRRLRGWGYSELEGVIKSINQHLKTKALLFEILDEFKIDVFKMEGLQQALATPKGEALVSKRMEVVSAMKNYKSSVIMDANDDYIQKEIQFRGLSDVMNENDKHVASELRIPMTKLFGLSASGFNSGEDDIENYNSMVESQVRAKVKFEIRKIVEIRCQQLFGFVPEDLDFEFKALRMMSTKDEEEVKTHKFNRLLQARQAGEIAPENFKEGCNQGELLATTLEVNDETFATAVSDTFGGREDGDSTEVEDAAKNPDDGELKDTKDKTGNPKKGDINA